jgi:uncharacterized protein YifE (UPF0438 family)
VIDLDSYEELLDRYGCMIKALEKGMAKFEKLKNENSFLKLHVNNKSIYFMSLLVHMRSKNWLMRNS